MVFLAPAPDGTEPALSVVVPCHDEAETIAPFHHRLAAVLRELGLTYEIICVNDGSRDRTLAQLLTLQALDPHLRILDLSRNFGKEAALTAGLDQARGAAVIPIDADLQDPPELIPALVAKWREGYDIVNAVRDGREGESWARRASAHLFYRCLNRLSEVPIPHDTGDFRLLSRAAIDALRQMPERRRFMKGMFAWVGFPTAEVRYRRCGRHAGHSNWTYWRLANLALEGITSFSRVPLRLASYLGLASASLSLLYGAFLLCRTLLFGNAVSGYPSIMLAVLFLGGLQLLGLGVMGEYIGRIYEETKHRPVYVVRRSWSGLPAPRLGSERFELNGFGDSLKP